MKIPFTIFIVPKNVSSVDRSAEEHFSRAIVRGEESEAFCSLDVDPEFLIDDLLNISTFRLGDPKDPVHSEEMSETGDRR
jgi:hypothetical protein